MTARIVFRISVVALLLYSAITQKCPASGRTESSIFGWMLRGHVYDTLLAELPFTCVFKCREDNRCQSFNWVISLLTCEFNNRTKEARPEDFIKNPDRSYYPRDLKRVPLGSIQELPAETCDEIKKSEGQTVSGKYWFSTIKSGTSVLAYCNMKTTDIDECSASSPVCDINANCFNTRGSYYCTCKAGYNGDGKTCQDTDECSVSSSVCDMNANCSNTRGSYYCTCKAGFTGDGKNCQDVDECTAGTHDCHTSATCTNTKGSFTCSCNPGYTGDGKNCGTGFKTSVIVGNNRNHLTSLSNWLKPVIKSVNSLWKRCWRASVDGWAANTFHSRCDAKGPTVTIIRVGRYIFGGYTSISWTSGGRYQYDSKAFLFSLVNKPGWAPVKFSQSGQYSYSRAHSIYFSSNYGPTFGGGHDINIKHYASSNSNSYSDLGHDYSPPSGHSYGSTFARTFMAGTYKFTPDEVETFYETT